MIPYFRIIEKIIAVGLSTWGGILLYTSCRSLVFLVGFVTGEELSISSMLIHYHIMLLVPLASVIAGLLLVVDHKTGWALAVITLLVNAFVWLIPQDSNRITPDASDPGYWILLAVHTVICLAAAFVLISKPFILQYSPGKLTWIAIAGITCFILVDRLLLLLL